MILNSLALVAGLAIVATFLAWPGQSASAANPGFNQTAAYEYILSNYNTTHGLVRENNNITKYWLWSDNLLAANVLGDYDYQTAATIRNNLRNYSDTYMLQYKHPQGVLFDQIAYFNGITDKKIADLDATSELWISDSDGSNALACSDFADIGFLKAIDYYRAGQVEDASACYYAAAETFDGIGLKDSVFAADGNRYSTYKLALWKIASNVTGFEDPKEPGQIIPYMQHTSGGVYTHYNPDLTPNSQLNTETTALAIIAFNGLEIDAAATEDSDSQEDRLLILGLLGAFVVAGFAVMLNKRR